MDQNIKLYITALVIILGGNASNIFLTANPDVVRPDPFTGLDGALLTNRVEQIEAQLKVNTKSLRSRDNRRWNLPDHIQWIDEVEALNPDWKGGTPKHTRTH